MDQSYCLAFLVKLYTSSGDLLYYTTHDGDVYINNINYSNKCSIEIIANSGVTDGNPISKVQFNAVNLGDINLQESLIEVLQYNTESRDITNLIKGYVYKTTQELEMITVFVAPLHYALNKTIGTFFSPLCRAELGDAQCGIVVGDRVNLRKDGSIVKVINNNTIIGNHESFVDYSPLNGIIGFSSGSNSGLKFRIVDFVNNSLQILPTPAKTLTVGDRYTITVGCDKQLTTCKNIFNNIVNFRGEPFINNN